VRSCALCLVLLAAAGTPWAAATPSELAVPACSAQRPQGEAKRNARPSDLKLSVSAEWSSTAGAIGVTWIVKLTNRTDAALRVVHPSSRYATVVLRQMGRGLYRAPRGGEYPAFWAWTLPPRATFACSLASDALDADALKTGRYDLSAYLNLTPSLLEAHRALSIVRG
jgi:hypothetical protein